jgi:GWxTD domain-containing protein
MRRFIFAAAAFLLWCGSFTASFSQIQPPDMAISKNEDVPDFFYDVITYASDDSTKTILTIYTKIAYDELQFVKDSTGYKGKYELSISVFNPRGEQADGRVLVKEARVPTYAQTNSRKDNSTAEVSFVVTPGPYELLIGLMDYDSKKTGQKKTKLNVARYGGTSLSLSDIFFIDQIRADSSGRDSYLPNVTGNYADKQDSMYFQFRIYHFDFREQVRIAWSVLDLTGKTIRTHTLQRMFQPNENTVVITLYKGDLKSGRYRLSLDVKNGKSEAKKVKEISVHWAGMPAYAMDLDHAVEQLRYIAKGGEIKKIRKASGEEKQRLFDEFWKSQDPTPGTDENELMDEYYRRVDFSNGNFAAFQDGWQTDRGMVYIILGPPEEIDRHPFESDSKPYEIWAYYRLNRSFLFIDSTGFGDYRLMNPSLFWEVVQQIR